MLPFEGERGPFRVVLIVGARAARGLGEALELSLQGLGPPPGPIPLFQ